MSRSITRRASILLTAGLVAAGGAACGPSGAGSGSGEASTATGSGSQGTIAVVARDYALQAPDSIPSGWVTFRFENQGKETHFFVLHHMPDTVTMEQYMAVAPLFDSVMSVLRSGGTKEDAGQLLVQGLPAWFADVHEMGGAGLVSPGGSTEVTEQLTPGNYYVRNAEGRFHGELGMVRHVTVTGVASGGTEPEADLHLTVSSQGIAMEGTPSAGDHVVSVHYQEQPQGLAGYDAHLVRLEEGQSVDDVVPWMDWMSVKGLETPAPATFLGGVQEMPAGNTSYVRVRLTPGRYAWISELGADQGMVKPFTVE